MFRVDSVILIISIKLLHKLHETNVLKINKRIVGKIFSKQWSVKNRGREGDRYENRQEGRIDKRNSEKI